MDDDDDDDEGGDDDDEIDRRRNNVSQKFLLYDVPDSENEPISRFSKEWGVRSWKGFG